MNAIWKGGSVKDLMLCRQALAEAAIEDENYLPLFESLDAEVTAYESSLAMDPIANARALVKCRRQAG